MAIRTASFSSLSFRERRYLYHHRQNSNRREFLLHRNLGANGANQHPPVPRMHAAPTPTPRAGIDCASSRRFRLRTHGTTLPRCGTRVPTTGIRTTTVQLPVPIHDPTCTTYLFNRDKQAGRAIEGVPCDRIRENKACRA